MATHKSARSVPLPDGWPGRVKSTMLNVLSLAQYAMAHTRSWAADSRNARLRLKAQVDRLEQLTTLGTEEMRIKDERMKRILPHKRPHYSPVERMAILELRAARAWSLRDLPPENESRNVC